MDSGRNPSAPAMFREGISLVLPFSPATIPMSNILHGQFDELLKGGIFWRGDSGIKQIVLN